MRKRLPALAAWQLEDVINRAYILADGSRITLDLPPEILRQGATPKEVDAFVERGGDLRCQMRLIEAGIPEDDPQDGVSVAHGHQPSLLALSSVK